ncbi:MAG: leucyl/phenylalanyl-tRNA--protein transferase [Pseudomonadota bacterium]
MSNRAAELELTPSLLLRAYAAGVFPMADSADADEVLWIDPQLRGIIPLNQFHAPRSLLKRVRRAEYDVTVDADFEAVIEGCAARDTTWINDEIRRLYVSLFRMGYAHSLEVWSRGDLVGGLYGVKLGGAFFGESMFSAATDASKVALVYLIARLKIGGFQLLDTQFVTDHLANFGARTISRIRYHELLELAINAPADFDRLDPETPPQDVAQLSTQRSYL